MVKINYDVVTGEILGFYPSWVKYVDVPSPTIEVSDEQHQEILRKKSRSRVNLTRLTVEEYADPGPTLDMIKGEKLLMLKEQLSLTDYMALKFYPDGELTEAEYAPIRDYRRALRAAFKSVEDVESLEDLEAINFPIAP